MRPLKAALALVPALLAAAGRASAGFGMPDTPIERGRIIGDLYDKIFIAGLSVFVLVFVLLVYILWRYRESTGKGRATHERERHSTAAEVAWLVGPLILVMWIGVISYQGLVALDTPDPNPVGEIAVTAGQWFWQFDYSGMPGGQGVRTIVTTTEVGPGNYTYSEILRIPADTPIHFNITANDVIHAFQVHDPHGAPFTFTDANPLGEHKYIGLTTTFPAGVYQVRCNKFCQNPGHANMLAQIRSEPRAQFDAWLKHRSQAVGAEIVHDLKLTLTETGFTPTDNLTLVTGQRLIVEATNPLATPEGFTVAGKSFTLAPGTTDFFHVDFPSAGGANLASTTGGSMAIAIVTAQPVKLVLRDFSLEPETLTLTAGTQYLIQVQNDGQAAHNYFIGHLRASGSEVLFKSADVGGGESASFLYTPTTSGQFDAWCNIPGHAELGMTGHAHVA